MRLILTFCKATWWHGLVQMLTKIWQKHLASDRNSRQRPGLLGTSWSERKMWNPAWQQYYRWPSRGIQCSGMPALNSLRPIGWNDSQHPLDHGIRTHHQTCRHHQIDYSRPFRSRPSSTGSFRSWNHTSMFRTCHHRRTFPFDWTSSMTSGFGQTGAAAVPELLSAARESVQLMSARCLIAARDRKLSARRFVRSGNSRTNSLSLCWRREQGLQLRDAHSGYNSDHDNKITTQHWTLLNFGCLIYINCRRSIRHFSRFTKFAANRIATQNQFRHCALGWQISN